MVMDKNPIENQDYLTDRLASWKIAEYLKHQRTKRWYVISFFLLAILIVYAVYTANFLFAVILIFIAIIQYFNDRSEPLQLDFSITPEGIMIDDKLYAYREIDNFYIIYEPPAVKNLYFIFKNILRPRLAIPLDDQDPVKIRELLRNYLEEDLEKEYEPLTDKLGRFLKL